MDHSFLASLERSKKSEDARSARRLPEYSFPGWGARKKQEKMKKKTGEARNLAAGLTEEEDALLMVKVHVPRLLLRFRFPESIFRLRPPYKGS